MPISKPNMDVVLAGGAKLVEVTRTSGEIIVAYGKPALQNAADLTTQAAKWGSANPFQATCAVGGGIGLAVVVVPSLVTAPVLSALGFTTGGIQAGSLAAASHSAVVNIAPGSLMAILQSAGAGGSGVAIVNGVAQAGGVAMSLGSAGLGWVKSRL